MDLYTTFKNRLTELEQLFDSDPETALNKMKLLKKKLRRTTYHDLYDSITLWLFHHQQEEYL